MDQALVMMIFRKHLLKSESCKDSIKCRSFDSFYQLPTGTTRKAMETLVSQAFAEKIYTNHYMFTPEGKQEGQRIKNIS